MMSGPATPAEVAAVLALKEGKDLTPVIHRTRGTRAQTYHKVSNYVSYEVLSTKQAVLAENVAADNSLKNRDSIAELRVASLICAPVMFEDQVYIFDLQERQIYRQPQNGAGAGSNKVTSGVIDRPAFRGLFFFDDHLDTIAPGKDDRGLKKRDHRNAVGEPCLSHDLERGLEHDFRKTGALGW